MVLTCSPKTDPWYDPNGESVGGYLLGLGEIALGGALILSGGIFEVATLGGFTIGLGFQVGAGLTLISTGLATTSYHSQPQPKSLDFPITSLQEYINTGLINIPVPEGYTDTTRIEKNSNQNKKSPGNTNSSKERKSPGNMQQQIQKGKSPKSIDRADLGRGPLEKDHIHFKDGSALNYDGTWKHGGRELTGQEIEWLSKNHWTTP